MKVFCINDCVDYHAIRGDCFQEAYDRLMKRLTNPPIKGLPTPSDHYDVSYTVISFGVPRLKKRVMSINACITIISRLGPRSVNFTRGKKTDK